MVKQARTIDLAVAIGDDDWVVELTRVLDMSIDGSTTTTNEVVLGQADEEASIHAVAQSFQFGTLYDGSETDALRLHSGDDSDSDPWVAVIEAKADLRSFEVARASVTGLAQTAPAADSITDSLTMPQSDRAYFGTGAGSVVAFDLRTGSLSQNLPNFNAGTAEIFVVILEKTGNQDVTIDSGPNSADVSERRGHPQGEPSQRVLRQHHQRHGRDERRQRTGIRPHRRGAGAPQWLSDASRTDA